MARNVQYQNSCAKYLNEVTCFEQLTEEEKQLIDNNSVEVVYKKGEIICKQGSFANHIIYLQEGLVKSYIEGSPRNLILNITPARRMVGLPSIFEGNTTFLYTVSTYVESTVKLIDINIFKQLLRTNANFASRVIDILNENTFQTYGRFYCLVCKQLSGRLADILLCLSQRIFKDTTFHLPMTRNDLAELTGMSTESVIRIMKDFKDEKLIDVNGKTISLLQVDKMVKISEFG